MTTTGECTSRLDQRRLVRDGTSQDARAPAALDPSYAPLDEHGPAQRIVYASAYSAFLRYFGVNDVAAGDWQSFFTRDVSAQIAMGAVADVAEYRSTVKGLVDRLISRTPPVPDSELVRTLGALFSAVASLARQLDALKETLPADHPLRAALVNLIRTQLAPAKQRLIAYYKGGQTLTVVGDAVPTPTLRVLGRPVTTFASVAAAGLSNDWYPESNATSWGDYYSNVGADTSGYGPQPAPTADLLNHLASHNEFTAILNVILRGYARVVADAKAALEETFRQTGHEPHYALFLAFARLLEHARGAANTLTAKHLDFYYRELLCLRERPAVAGHVHLLVELARQVDSHLVAAGTRVKAGKDDRGIDAFFAADRDLAANRAQVVERRTVYRHHNSPDDTLPLQDGRIFASPVADSDDGQGAALTTPDKSWHPFFNKVYDSGALTAIRMPPADVGFAIASHYLWLAEGARTITIDITTVGGVTLPDLTADVTCLLTTEEGWLEKPPTSFKQLVDGATLRLTINLSGEDPAITPYVAATHKLSFDTDLPMLVFKLRHRADAPWCYPLLEELLITKVDVHVKTDGLRTLLLANDFGAVDASKPFQPYGPAPTTNSAFVIGSTEAFQKHLTAARLHTAWMTDPVPYKTSPHVHIDALVQGRWAGDSTLLPVSATSYDLTGAADQTVVEAHRLTPDEPYGTTSRHGFVRLRLHNGFGQDTYAVDLANSIVKKKPRPTAPVIPTISSVTLSYEAAQTISFDPSAANETDGTPGGFLHVGPFGHAEQHPPTTGTRTVTLLPRFTTDDGAKAEAELCLGIAGLRPPQNLALLVQIVDGTANPLAAKPSAHVQWSYLRDNQWVPFADDAVDDRTDGLLESGIVTLSVPADASDDNTILPSGRHWVRAVVHTASDAVCRLLLVAAQGVRATFTDEGNDSTFPAKMLPPGTISKLAQPDAAIKTLSQPFASFGGQAAEGSSAFATRISERLRHKDRAIALWDYERLVLEAFPSIHRARCLNHTRYEPNAAGTGIYRELAPGHVTVVTIPEQQPDDRRDPLRPFTSLGVLSRIEAFLAVRLPCFVTLHVRNPQFEEVFVDFRVRLRDGYDETFHVSLLRTEITRFLSPWAFTGAASPTFTGRVYKSVLIDFVEERPYVDYVTDFRLFHRYLAHDDAGDLVEVVSPDADSVTGSCAVSILVSVPPAEHVVTVIHLDEEQLTAQDCPCEVRSS